MAAIDPSSFPYLASHSSLDETCEATESEGKNLMPLILMKGAILVGQTVSITLAAKLINKKGEWITLHNGRTINH